VYANLGYSSVTTGVNDGDHDDFTFGTATGRVGLRFHRYIGIEGEVGLGIKNDHQLVSGQTVKVRLATEAEAYVVGFLPLSDHADLLARVGYGNVEYRLNGGPFNRVSADKGSLNYGIGAQYLFDGRNGLRLDFTRYDLKGKGADANAFAIAFVHRF
jgi:outer membrane immunogenic protein